MAKYLLLDLGNSNIKAAIYDDADKSLSKSFCWPNNTLAKDIMKQFDGIKIDYIFEMITTNTSFYLRLNNHLKTMLPTTKFRVLRTADFLGVLKEERSGRYFELNTFISVDFLLSVFWLKEHTKNGCLVNLGAFYFAVTVKGGLYNDICFLPSITTAYKILIGKDTPVLPDEVPEQYKEVNVSTSLDAISNGGIALIEGFINKIIRDNKLTDKDVIISGGDIEAFPQLAKRFTVDKDVFFKALVLMLDKANIKWE